MIKGIHHIGLTVHNLDETVTFYKEAAGFEEVDRSRIADNALLSANLSANQYNDGKVVLLNAQTCNLVLTHLPNPPYGLPPNKRAVQGPGITHICYQSAADDSCYEKFKASGMKPLSRGTKPVDLAGRGITYAYARDMDGNIFEMEEWDTVPPTAPQETPVWLAHVALVSPDIQRLANFYSTILMNMDAVPDIPRFRENPRLDEVADLVNVDLYGTWIATPNVLIEIWQYVNPPTPTTTGLRSLTEPGYSHIAFEVDDLNGEIERLREHGVSFTSEPIHWDQQSAVFGHDPDGNLFQLMQL